MSANDDRRETVPSAAAASPEAHSSTRAPYCSPQLTLLGDIRSLTMGTSAGSTDSGGFGRPPGGSSPGRYRPTPPYGNDGRYPPGPPGPDAP
jgi:hypothetical protein